MRAVRASARRAAARSACRGSAGLAGRCVPSVRALEGRRRDRRALAAPGSPAMRAPSGERSKAAPRSACRGSAGLAGDACRRCERSKGGGAIGVPWQCRARRRCVNSLCSGEGISNSLASGGGIRGQPDGAAIDAPWQCRARRRYRREFLRPARGGCNTPLPFVGMRALEGRRRAADNGSANRLPTARKAA
jgi:hypothetical protein